MGLLPGDFSSHVTLYDTVELLARCLGGTRFRNYWGCKPFPLSSFFFGKLSNNAVLLPKSAPFVDDVPIRLYRTAHNFLGLSCSDPLASYQRHSLGVIRMPYNRVVCCFHRYEV